MRVGQQRVLEGQCEDIVALAGLAIGIGTLVLLDLTVTNLDHALALAGRGRSGSRALFGFGSLASLGLRDLSGDGGGVGGSGRNTGGVQRRRV